PNFSTRPISSTTISESWHRYSFSISGERYREVVVMTTLRQIELLCPVCDNEFKSQSVVSTNAFGGKRTDFHERAAGTQPLAYLIHMCSECGYSGGEADFTAPTDVSPVLKQHVLTELAPLRPALVSGSEKYEAAAKVAEWQGMDS